MSFQAKRSDERDVDVVGEARNGQQAVELARSLRPVIVLMDVRLPELDSVRATDQTASEKARIILLTTYDDDLVLQLSRSGLQGTVLNSRRLDEAAIERRDGARVIGTIQVSKEQPSASQLL